MSWEHEKHTSPYADFKTLRLNDKNNEREILMEK